MQKDIREKDSIDHEDVVALNFVRNPGAYFFRRHFRQGLRSHIMEVLDPDDLARERRGVLKNGIRWFPRATPLKMLRIFRRKFQPAASAFEEARNFELIKAYLPPGSYAMSSEFLVDYRLADRCDILLCGLQEYVPGSQLDPWGISEDKGLARLVAVMQAQAGSDNKMAPPQLERAIRKHAAAFIDGIRRMISDAGHVPDLAGIGNLLVTPAGRLKLVDINNISRIRSDPVIPVDDKGYPVCDKSIEAIALLQKNLIGRPIDPQDRLYRTFLAPDRMRKAAALERAFRRRLKERPPGKVPAYPPR